MSEIVPFRALRYNPRIVPDLTQVVTPPYDVISPAAQERYYARHPHNVVRLILPKADATDTADNNRYTRAAAAFTSWRREEVLRRDPTPAVYLYEQVFSIGEQHPLRRRGLLALVRLHDYADRMIFPHERTFARHKDDRLQLMRACPANLEAILGFYPGSGPAIGQVLDRHMGTSPAVQLVDEDGVGHRLWLVQDPPEVQRLQEALRDQPIVIADGHHRYETAWNYRNEGTGGVSAAAAGIRPPLQDFVLMNLVQADDPGLVILPTHRILRCRLACVGKALVSALARHFSVEPFPLDLNDPLRSLRVALADIAQRPEAGTACVVYAGGPVVWALRLTDAAPALAGLHMAVLHRLIVEETFGIPSGPLADQSIDYTRDESQALAAVLAQEASAAVFLNPPRVEDVYAVAVAGERMPHKSTFFFPKVLSGLVINPLDGNDNV